MAVTDNGIVASGDSLPEVSSVLSRKGMKLDEVMVMKVPRKDEEMLAFVPKKETLILLL